MMHISEELITSAESIQRFDTLVVEEMMQLFHTFSEDYFKAQDSVNLFLQKREKLLSASAKVVDMNKQKKVILNKLQQVEEEREDIGKEFDVCAGETTAALHESMLTTKLNFLDSMAHILEGRIALYETCLQSYSHLFADIKTLRETVC